MMTAGFKTILLLEDNDSNLKKIHWIIPLGGVDNVYMLSSSFGQQIATIFTPFAEHVYVLNYGGSGPPPVPTNAILTEAGEFYLTEDGDFLVQE